MNTKKILAILICIGLLLSGCGRRELNAVSGEDKPSSASVAPIASSIPSPVSQPQEALPQGEYFVRDGVRYLRDEGRIWDEEGYSLEDMAEHTTIKKVVSNPKEDGEANFGQSGQTVYRDNSKYSAPNRFLLYYFEDGMRYELSPTEFHLLAGTPSAEEKQFEIGIKALEEALKTKDYKKIAELALIEDKAELYKGLANTDLTVEQVLYRGSTDPYGMQYYAYIDIDVKRSDILPMGKQRLSAGFMFDPRKNHPSGSLPLGTLTNGVLAGSHYEQTDEDHYGGEVGDMITYRIDGPFSGPNELDQILLCRLVVPYAYARAVREGNGVAGPLTPERVRAAAEILFGISDFNTRNPQYFDESTGNYTLKNHSTVTAGMGNAIDQIDEGLNFYDTFGDKDGYRYVTVTHFTDPLKLIVGRVLEYKVEKVFDPITEETVGRVLSAVQIK